MSKFAFELKTMARKRKELPELSGVEISGIAAEGKAFAKVKLKETDEDRMVVFIPYGAPGDIADVKIDKKKNKYAEGHIVSLLRPSELRIPAPCEYFGTCGGCKWQHLPYHEQLKFKRQQVEDAIKRIGKVETPEIPMTLGSEDYYGYRNKMEYTFSNKRWRSWEELRGEKEFNPETNALGFHIPGAFDKVLQINKCLLQVEIGDRIRNFIFEYAISHGLTFFDIKENRGLLRTLMIRPLESGELMVCIVFGEEDKDKINPLMASVMESFPEITTLVYVVNRKVNDSISDQEVSVYFGPGFVEERMGDLKYRISAKSFYQTNSRQAERLYGVAAEFAGLDGSAGDQCKKPVVYDLYTGAGTIANYVASQCEKVIGIEYVEDAVEDARINSAINHIENTEFFAGDMKDVLTEEFVERHGRPDVMIIDPPRAGMHEDVIKVILKVAPKVIVYVSCNPATQARDISMMDAFYKVTKVQPVDMFPQTHHVENVVRLELRDEAKTDDKQAQE